MKRLTACLALIVAGSVMMPAAAEGQCGACLADEEGPTMGHAIVNSSTMPDYEPRHSWEFGDPCCACHDQSCGIQASIDSPLGDGVLFDLTVDVLNAYALTTPLAVAATQRLGGVVDWERGVLRVELCDGVVEVPFLAGW